MKKLVFSVALAGVVAAGPAMAEAAKKPAAEAPKAPTDSQRYDGCIRAIPTHAAEAEEFAIQWRARGGGLPARHCQALAELQQGRYQTAMISLVAAARTAEQQKSPFAPDFWGQAGNAAMLAGEDAQALTYFNTAITQAGDADPVRAAGLHVDRARALTDAGRLDDARADLDKALELRRDDPIAWTLSAALARRQDDMGRAVREIAEASDLAPSDPDVMFEQANIAAANGDMDSARKVWAMVEKASPDTQAGKLAHRALAGETQKP